MTTLTAGPAMAMRNSSLGFSGMRSSRDTPPIGKRITSGVADPERARGEDVPEFVQQHAQEQQHHEQEAAPGRLRASRDVAHAENPGEKQEERHMDADRRAGDRSDLQGPAHGNLPKQNLAPCRTVC